MRIYFILSFKFLFSSDHVKFDYLVNDIIARITLDYVIRWGIYCCWFRWHLLSSLSTRSNSRKTI